MLSANKVVHAEDTCTSVTGFICAKCQNYNICMNRFNTSFCTKDHKTHKAIYCYTLLLHQAARGEGKKGYFSFWSWSTTIFHHYNNLILIYNVLSSYRLYYVQFKEVKILWGLGVGGRRLDNPNTLFKKCFHLVYFTEQYLFTLQFKYMHRLSIIQDNFTA